MVDLPSRGPCLHHGPASRRSSPWYRTSSTLRGSVSDYLQIEGSVGVSNLRMDSEADGGASADSNSILNSGKGHTRPYTYFHTGVCGLPSPGNIQDPLSWHISPFLSSASVCALSTSLAPRHLKPPVRDDCKGSRRLGRKIGQGAGASPLRLITEILNLEIAYARRAVGDVRTISLSELVSSAPALDAIVLTCLHLSRTAFCELALLLSRSRLGIGRVVL